MLHDLGVLPVPGFQLALAPVLVERGVGELAGQAVAHLVELLQPLLAAADLGAESEAVLARGARRLGLLALAACAFEAPFPFLGIWPQHWPRLDW